MDRLSEYWILYQHISHTGKATGVIHHTGDKGVGTGEETTTDARSNDIGT